MFGKLKDAHLRELLEGSSTALFFRVLGLALGYAVTLLITRNYGADAMGVYALSLTLLSVFSVAGRLGFDVALVRFVAEYSSQQKWGAVKEVYAKAVRVLVPLCLFLSALMFFASPYLSRHVFGKEHLAAYFRVIAFAVLPIVLVAVNAESLRGLKRIRDASFVQNVSVPLFAALLLGLAVLFQWGDSAPVAAYATSVAIAAVASSALWARRSKPGEVKTADDLDLKALIAVSLPMMLSSSLMLVMQWIDTIMLGMLRTEAEVGVYNVAAKVSMLTSITLVAVNSIAAPKFAELYGSGDMGGLGETVRHSTRLIFWSSVPVLVLLFAFPSFILGFFGSEFKSGAAALLILSVGQFVNAVSGSVGYLLAMTGRQKVFQNILLAATAMNVILNIVLIPRYGLNGAAFASMVSMVLWNVAAAVYIQRRFGIRTYYFPVRQRANAEKN